MAEVFFTVALATYDRADRLPSAVARVQAQTFPDWELVVVDDGSTDDTPAVAAGLAEGDPRIRVVTRPNGGISAARNTGAQAARGRYLVFLDDDDQPAPTWLERFHAVLVADDAAFVSCGSEVVTPDGRVLEVQRPQRRSSLFGGVVAHLLAGTFAVRADAFAASGGYAEGLQCSHQTELALRLLPLCVERGWMVSAIDEPLVRIERRAAGNRPESSPAKLLSGTTYLLETHREQLRHHPHVDATWSAVAGVAAARLGDLRLARRHLGHAARTDPRNPRHAARWAVASVPPLARRVWGGRRRDA